MICPKCKGTGQISESGVSEYPKIKCPCCNGTGEIEQTNEEWFCGLSTEEKARFLGNEGWRWNQNYDYTRRSECWLEWLKAVHEE